MKYAYKHIVKIILLLIVLIPIDSAVLAGHLVGGAMTYECLGNDDYKITLTLYRDCDGVGADFDLNAVLGIFNNDNLINTETSPFTSKILLGPPAINNPCLVVPEDCIEKTSYTQIINLPPISGGYDIAYQRCCRNSSAINIVNPSGTGSTYTVHIPEANIAICNSSPTFNNSLPRIMCAGYEFTYDLSATDTDGDSLHYSFNNPYTGGSSVTPMPNPPSNPPFTNVIWNPGYATNYQIDANPVFTIDPATGFLVGTPTTVGYYTFSIGVKEYRNGVFVSEIYSDFLLYVNNCQTNTVADFSDTPLVSGQSNFCSGTTVNFLNNSLNSTYYFWDFGDLSTNSDTSNLENPSYTYADTGVYDIMLIANPGYFCADTVIYPFSIFPALLPSFNAQPNQCLQNNLFSFNALGNNDINDTILWNFSPNGQPTNSNTANAQTSFTSPGTYPIELTLKNFGCSTSYLDSITVLEDPTAIFSPQTIFCNGLTVSLDNNSLNYSDIFWDFDDSNNSTTLEPNHTFADSGSYNIMLIAKQQNACADTTYQNFEVYPLLNVNFSPQADQCFINNSFSLEAFGNFNSSAIINWDFASAGNPTNTNSVQTQISFDAAGTYPVLLSIQNYGCTASDSSTLRIFLEPKAEFSVNNRSGCVPFKTAFNNNSTSSTPLTYHWNFGNGSTSNAITPENTYYEPGVYNVSLIASTSTGCIGSDTLTLDNLIIVNPNPEAKFNLSPVETYFINHLLTAQDLTPETQHEFNFGDGNIYTDSIVTHIYEEPGHYIFEQLVTNQYDCTTKLNQKIWIKPDFLFFPPTAFSPNGDGLNDIFIIKTNGILTYNMKIFNRWGEIIHSSDNPTAGWNGIYQGKIAPTGIYTWKVELKTIDHTIHKRIGSINLIK